MKQEHKAKTSNIVLAALGVFLLLFIVTMVIVFCVKGSVPDTLIQCVLGGGLGEAVAMAAIKISKVMKGESKDESELETEIDQS